MAKQAVSQNKFSSRSKLEKIFLEGWHPYLWIAAAAFLIYAQTLFFGFTNYDDSWLILDNQDIITNFGHIGDFFKSDVFVRGSENQAYYRPLLNVSLMLDSNFAKTEPFIYHCTNLFLHILVSCLVFIFFKRLGNKDPASFIFSIIYATHPALSQVAAWIPGRNDSLLALFILPAFFFFMDFAKSRKLIPLFLHLLFFALALFTTWIIHARGKNRQSAILG